MDQLKGQHKLPEYWSTRSVDLSEDLSILRWIMNKSFWKLSDLVTRTGHWKHCIELTQWKLLR